MTQFGKTMAGSVLALTVAVATPAMAKTYKVVFAGKVVEVDCPESPDGHNLTWVNQNCTSIRVGPPTAAARSRSTSSANQ